MIKKYPDTLLHSKWLFSRGNFLVLKEKADDRIKERVLLPRHPKVPSPQVIRMPLSLANTENPSPAPTLVIDFALGHIYILHKQQ